MSPEQFGALVERRNQGKAEDRAFMCNVMGCKKDNDEPYEAADFMPQQTDDEDESAGWDKLCGQMAALAASRGGLNEG